MKILLLFLLAIVTLMSAKGSEEEHDEIKEKLNNLSEQLDRIESVLNNSISQLLSKIDDGNHDITQLIKAHHDSPTKGKQPFS